MSKRIYEPCGKIVLTATSKAAKIKTYLPTSISTYQYVKYYNISTPDRYAILGVLVHQGLNRDLRTLGGTSDSLSIGGNIDLLNDLDNSYSQRSFASITDKDSIIFICFHDDNFECDGNKVLRHYNTNLHLYPLIPTYPNLTNCSDDPNKGAKWDAQPKIGDGGILTFTGSCN